MDGAVDDDFRRRAQRLLALGQGTYFAVTGVWPLLSLSTFEKVTGPKTDGWLVKTVGVLVAAIGGTLALASRRERVPDEVRLLAVASALGLGAVDVVYASSGRIRRIYLLDAVAEVGLAAAWGVTGQPEIPSHPAEAQAPAEPSVT